MFRINASEVAALVGKNPYKSQDEAIQDCWNRNKKGLPPMEIMRAKKICKKNKEVDDAYNKMMEDIKKTETNSDVIEKKAEFSEKISAIIVGKVDEEITKTKENFEQDIMYAKNDEDKKKIEKMFSDEMQELEKKRTRAVEEATQVEKVAISKFNTNYGTRKESNVGASYAEVTGMTVEKTNKRHTWDIYPGFEVVGKFDGFADDGTLVEIKNRMRRLFGVVKEYENVQIHIYMKMANVTTAHLAEKFEDKIMVHDVLYDDDFMIEIESELENVIKNYFLKNE